MPLLPNLVRLIMLLIFHATLASGCALHYFDPATGTEHIWGVGHMKMKATKPNEGLQTVVHGTNLVGFSVGKADNQTYLTIGWNRLESIDILAENTSVRLEWPDGSLFNVRVGSEFPRDPRFSVGEENVKASPDFKTKESYP